VESYRTEEEQVEALKRWWKENGTNTLITVLVVVALTFGWQGWQARQAARAEAASGLFQQLVEALDTAPAEDAAGAEADAARAEVRALATRLKTDYDGTTYAHFAALHLARLQVAGGELEAAEAELRGVVDATSRGEDLHRVARLRLGRVLASRGATEEALELLTGDANGPYAGAYAMARGDLLLAAGRDADARAAYLEAQELADPAQPLRGLAEKLDFLNPQPPTVGAAAAGA
jgi:predicted negative regulator of RcsB-dependent stress response